MRPDTGWSTVQMPSLVSTSAGQKACYVAPAIKERQAAQLQRAVAAFLSEGGQIERLPAPRPPKSHGRKA